MMMEVTDLYGTDISFPYILTYIKVETRQCLVSTPIYNQLVLITSNSLPQEKPIRPDRHRCPIRL